MPLAGGRKISERLVLGQMPIVLESVSGRVLQVKIAIALGLEIDDQAIIVDICDDIGHIDQLGQ
jgi:hypothetical protein